MSNVVITPALPAQDAAIGGLLIRSFVNTYARLMPEVVVTEHRKSDLRNVARRRETAKVLAATVDGTLAGTVSLFLPGSPDCRAWLPGVADLRMLAVDPDFHGFGIGAALLDAAERLAWHEGAEGVSIHVRRGAHGLVRMYEARGYRRRPDGDRDELPTIYLEGFVLPRPAPR